MTEEQHNTGMTIVEYALSSINHFERKDVRFDEMTQVNVLIPQYGVGPQTHVEFAQKSMSSRGLMLSTIVSPHSATRVKLTLSYFPVTD